MSTARAILHTLADEGFGLATGVPCSLLAGAFSLLESPDDPMIQQITYVPAPREDSAIGVASGAAIAGRRSVVFMQNSGLGYSLNVITSFNLIYEVPVLLVVSWRGHGGNDAVEHDVIGREMLNLLEVFELPHAILDHADARGSVIAVIRRMEKAGRCAALIVREGI